MSKPGSRCLAIVDDHKSEADCDEPSPSKTASGQPAHANKPKRPASSSSKSRGPSRKQPRVCSPGDGTGHEEGSGYVATHSKQQSPEARLACPFFKHDPSSCRGLRSCQIGGWTSIVRLKEHIKRNHEEDMNDWQIDKLRSRAKYSSKPDGERWLEIYSILFPKAEKPPTPYCFDLNNHPEGFGSSLNYEVLRLLRGKLADDTKRYDNVNK
ncbi:hypothetical protein HG530_013080 [Fusarium avenaceum]|nr:hypothetical protein HG530_013080 [Fusarium avenaceum]